MVFQKTVKRHCSNKVREDIMKNRVKIGGSKHEKI